MQVIQKSIKNEDGIHEEHWYCVHNHRQSTDGLPKYRTKAEAVEANREKLLSPKQYKEWAEENKIKTNAQKIVDESRAVAEENEDLKARLALLEKELEGSKPKASPKATTKVASPRKPVSKADAD